MSWNTVFSIAIYLAVFSASALLVSRGLQGQKKVLIVFGLLLPILLATFRYDVGLDYDSYLNAYADVINPQEENRYPGTNSFEPSFFIFSHIANGIFRSPVALFFIYSAITVLAFYAALRIMKVKNIGIPLLLFYSIFFLNSLNIMRQGAAISVGCVVISYYANSQKKKAFLMTLLAMAIHQSALLLLFYFSVAWCLEKFQIFNIKTKTLTKVIAIVVFVSTLFAFFGIAFPDVGRYVYSITGRIGFFGNELSLGIVFKYILAIGSSYLLGRYWAKLSYPEKRISLLSILGIAAYSLGIVHNEAARIGMYLIAYIPITFVLARKHMTRDGQESKIVPISILAVGVSFLYIISVHFGGEGVQYQYRTVIFSEEYPQKIKELGV